MASTGSTSERAGSSSRAAVAEGWVKSYDEAEAQAEAADLAGVARRRSRGPQPALADRLRQAGRCCGTTRLVDS